MFDLLGFHKQTEAALSKISFIVSRSDVCRCALGSLKTSAIQKWKVHAQLYFQSNKKSVSTIYYMIQRLQQSSQVIFLFV